MNGAAFLFAAAILAACPAAAEAPAVAIALDEVTADSGEPIDDAMPLAARLLPPELQGRVVAGRIERQWLPGQAFLAVFREAPRMEGERLCAMIVHSAPVQNLQARADAPPDLPLSIEAVSSNETIAVLPPSGEAACGEDLPYIVRREGLEGIYQEAAYRRLLGWVDAARGGRDPGLAIACVSDDAGPCDDPLAALASVSVDDLLGIQALNPRQFVISQEGSTRVLGREPLSEADPHIVTVSFGASPPGNHSWTLGWTENGDAPPVLEMRRGYIARH